MSSLIIYTAAVGRQDEVQPPRVVSAGAVYVCFTDIPETVPPPWRARPADWYAVSPDPVRVARWYKVLAHHHFPDLGPADVSVWQDATHSAIRDYNELDLGAHDLALLPHFSRDCLYDEADQVCLNGLDDCLVVQAQLERFLAEGFPAHYGLHDGSFLARRHTAATRRFNELWWETIVAGSRRDQLSLDYARWRCRDSLKFLTLGRNHRLGGVSRQPHAAGAVVANQLFAFQARDHRTRPFTPWL